MQSWDTACTTSELASYSVGITAQINKTGTIHVLDIVRGRWEFTDLVREIEKRRSAIGQNRSSSRTKPRAQPCSKPSSGTGMP